MPRLTRAAFAALLVALLGCSRQHEAGLTGDGGADGGSDIDTDADTDADPDELCNGLDDDGDGETDEEVVDCEGYDGCHVGQCVWFCEHDGWGDDDLCPQDHICVRIYLEWVCALDVCNPELDLALPCVDNPYWCDEGFVPPCDCEVFYGLCADACFMTACPDGFVCINDDGSGICHQEGSSCYVDGCPEGEMCLGFTCVSDPCHDVACEDGEYCNSGGECVPPCTLASDCPIGCFEGECVDDPCAGVACEEFFECLDGECVQGPCWGVVCEFWEVCVDGACVDDPCWNIDCPNGYQCIGGGCYEYESPTDLTDTGPDGGK